MITNTMIAFGDQLGAQMTSLACLYYIAKENNQDIVFFEELKNFKRGYQFFDVFDIKDIKLIKLNNCLVNLFEKYINSIDYRSMSWKLKMKRIYNRNLYNFIDKLYYFIFKIINNSFITYKLNNNLHTDDALLNLESDKNYDINNGFETYQDWKKYENEIIELFSFKQSIIEQANKDEYLIDIIKNNNSISIHFRQIDYLVMSSLNLDKDYYMNALKMFNKNDYYFIFSDDIRAIKSMNLFEKYDNVYYVKNKSAALDIYYMSLCKNNIIANTTFSFWGG